MPQPLNADETNAMQAGWLQRKQKLKALIATCAQRERWRGTVACSSRRQTQSTPSTPNELPGRNWSTRDPSRPSGSQSGLEALLSRCLAGLSIRQALPPQKMRRSSRCLHARRRLRHTLVTPSVLMVETALAMRPAMSDLCGGLPGTGDPPEGQINPSGCIYCLASQVSYQDDHVCPALIERRKRRERRQASIAKAGMLVDTSNG